MILSLGFGLVAAIGISQLMKANKVNANQPVQEMGPVLVAGEVIGMKTILSEEHVRLENWPKSIIPEGVATSLEDITDMSAIKPLSKGAPIFKDDMIHKNKSIGIEIPEGFKVVSIKVNAEDHSAGLLNPGDRVDVMGLFKRRNPKDGSEQTLSRTFLKALQVFSIDGRLSAISRLDEENKNNTGGNVIVGVLVSEKQAEEIFWVQKTGNIKLVMRGDPNSSDEDYETLNDIMEMTGAGDLSSEEMDQQVAMMRETNQPTSMVIWRGDKAVKVIIEDGELPQAIGTTQETGFTGPPIDPEDAQREIDDDEDDFDGRKENNRRSEEDQSRSE